jgi:hypothetical protein
LSFIKTKFLWYLMKKNYTTKEKKLFLITTKED